MENSTKLGILGVASLLAIGVATPLPVANADEHKVRLCHFTPPGQLAKFRVVEVSQSAVPAHLRHGDAFAFRKGLSDFCAFKKA